MKFKLISNLDEAEKAWKSLSPNKVIYDDWDFRYAYYKYFNYPLYFYAAYDNEELVALLPLMLNTDTNLLDFFAGFEYMEDNRVFAKQGYEYLAQDLINLIEIPAYLNYMHESMSEIKDAYIHDYNYFIKLEGLSSYEDFINKHMSGDGRRNLHSQIRKINTGNIRILGTKNLEELDIMEHFNRNRFGDHSSYAERPHWNHYFKDIGRLFEHEIIEVVINEKKQGVGYLIKFKDIWYGINNGFNLEIKNLGKYITLLKIDHAIKNGARIYDAGGSGAFGWKEDFKLDKRPLYALEINYKHEH